MCFQNNLRHSQRIRVSNRYVGYFYVQFVPTVERFTMKMELGLATFVGQNFDVTPADTAAEARSECFKRSFLGCPAA